MPPQKMIWSVSNVVWNTKASAFLFQTTFLHLGGYSTTDTITRALFLNNDIPVDLSKVYELLISALLKTSIGRFLDVVTAARKFLKYLIATKEDS